jgi:hypothetical protein
VAVAGPRGIPIRLAATRLLVACGLLGLSACSPSESPQGDGGSASSFRDALRPAHSADPLRDAVWDDGQAEFSVYDGVTRLEGQERGFTAKIIAVKEDFVRQSLVKSDEGPIPGKTFEVIKFNYVRDVPTGMYDYHQMVSVFFDRRDFHPVKYAASSMESCGLTYVIAKPERRRLRHTSHSYWDGEADRVLDLNWPPGTAFYDALPLWLRGFDLETPARRQWRFLPSQLQNRVGTPEVEFATLDFEGPDASRDGRLLVRMTHGAGVERLWFEREAPHVLWRWEKANGTVLALRKTQRIAYWQHTAPEDAALLGEPMEVPLP